MLTEWSQKLEQMSGGRVKTVLYFSGGLFPQREVIRSVLAGVGDVSFDYSQTEDPGLMVLNLFFDLPFLGWNTAENGTKVLRELFVRIPEMTKEYQGLKVLYPTMWGDANWNNSTKKQVQTSADLKGLKYISQGYGALWFQAMGATPVNLSWPDFYTSMEKGIVDSTISGFGPMLASGMMELFKYHTYVPTVLRPGFVVNVMNNDTFNKLPPDIQKIILDLEPWYTERRISLERESNVAGLGIIKEKGRPLVELSPAVVQEWLIAAKPTHEQWIKEAEAKGKPARAFYTTLMELIQQYK